MIVSERKEERSKNLIRCLQIPKCTRVFTDTLRGLDVIKRIQRQTCLYKVIRLYKLGKQLCAILFTSFQMYEVFMCLSK